MLVNVCSGSRVARTIVRGESHQRLQVGQDLLGETVDDCSIMECRQVGNVRGDVEAGTHSVVLHVLIRVQAVEDVTSERVEEQVVVILQ